MTKVLIAVDDSDESVNAAEVAHRLFGDAAEYLVVNVAETVPAAALAWGATYPVAMPFTYPPPPVDAEVEAELASDAEAQAAQAAREAHIDADAIGAAGDPVNAILAAAHEHGADVVVVGSHDRSWFSRLISRSVTAEVLRESKVPVLVVK